MLYNRTKKIEVTVYHIMYDDRKVEIQAMTKQQLASFRRTSNYKKAKPFVTKLTTVRISYQLQVHNLK